MRTIGSQGLIRIISLPMFCNSLDLHHEKFEMTSGTSEISVNESVWNNHDEDTGFERSF
jgi:hypothetical protein